MDENKEPTKPAAGQPTPEVDQLIKMLELQTALQRSKRAGMPAMPQGMSFRWVSIVAVLIFALGSVAFMEWMISQLPKPPGSGAANVTPGMSVPGGVGVGNRAVTDGSTATRSNNCHI
jgi:hypothetical protein